MYSNGTDNNNVFKKDSYKMWLQIVNPMLTTENGSSLITNSSNLKKPATDNKNFGGLAKSNQTSATFLNGDMGNTWYNAVATKASWNNGIPGGNDTAAAQCLLFVRIK